jgi:hypothetical protein
VDSEGEVLDILVQPRRDCNAALKLMPGRCVGGRCEIIRLDPMLLNPLITNRNRRALGDEWRDGYRVVTPAAMDAWGHHIARRRAAGIEAVLRQPFADDVAVGHHPDQPVVLYNRNGTYIMLTASILRVRKQGCPD